MEGMAKRWRLVCFAQKAEEDFDKSISPLCREMQEQIKVWKEKEGKERKDRPNSISAQKNIIDIGTFIDVRNADDQKVLGFQKLVFSRESATL